MKKKIFLPAYVRKIYVTISNDTSEPASIRTFQSDPICSIPMDNQCLRLFLCGQRLSGEVGRVRGALCLRIDKRRGSQEPNALSHVEVRD